MNLLRKADLKRHQCEDCKKSFKCKLMKEFHKQLHHQPPSVVEDHRFRLGKYFFLNVLVSTTTILNLYILKTLFEFL